MYTVERDADNDNLITVYDWDGDEIYSAYPDEFIIWRDPLMNNQLRTFKVGELTDMQLLIALAEAVTISFNA